MAVKCPYAERIPVPQALIDIIAKWDTYCLKIGRRVSSKSHPCYTERYDLCQWYTPPGFKFVLPKKRRLIEVKAEA